MTLVGQHRDNPSIWDPEVDFGTPAVRDTDTVSVTPPTSSVRLSASASPTVSCTALRVSGLKPARSAWMAAAMAETIAPPIAAKMPNSKPSAAAVTARPPAAPTSVAPTMR